MLVNRERCLIVNADDFGQSSGVNRGVIEAFEKGVVTSASLMVRWAAAAEAAAYAREHPELSIGLHVDLCEWTYSDGAWTPLYEVVGLDNYENAAREVQAQLRHFRQLCGEDPTHMDSHQHVHCEEPVRSILSEIGSQLGVPVRESGSAIRYCGSFYGQSAKGEPVPGAITVDALIDILARLPEGVTELGCHPGLDDDLSTMYRSERTLEVAVLCDPRIRAAIAAQGIRLCSFRGIHLQ